MKFDPNSSDRFFQKQLNMADPNEIDLTEMSPFTDLFGRQELSQHSVRNMPSDPTTVDSRRNAVWRQVILTWFLKFNAEPYTSFWMVHYLSSSAGISCEQLLDNPKILPENFTEADIKKTMPFAALFAALFSSPGRCITFAIQIAEPLNAIQETSFKFCDTGGHRLARCSNTGILVDINLEGGPFVLQEDVPETHSNDSRPQTFSYQSGQSNFKTTNRLDHPIAVSSAENNLQRA
jgi:hypothetical protein